MIDNGQINTGVGGTHTGVGTAHTGLGGRQTGAGTGNTGLDGSHTRLGMGHTGRGESHTGVGMGHIGMAATQIGGATDQTRLDFATTLLLLASAVNQPADFADGAEPLQAATIGVNRRHQRATPRRLAVKIVSSRVVAVAEGFVV